MTPPAVADRAATGFNRTWLILPSCLAVAPTLLLAISYGLMRAIDAFALPYLCCYMAYQLYALVVLGPLTALGVDQAMLVTQPGGIGPPTPTGFALIIIAYGAVAVLVNRLVGVRMRSCAPVAAPAVASC
ncbi:MAG TPA: hypothetical protein VEL07_01730 [Planctomycetota bacterium]|nr:hypothetical protein [Planctomycetota bacterium]